MFKSPSFDPDNQLVDADALVDMHISDIGQNERPLDKSVKEVNNNFMKEFRDKMLVHYTDSNNKLKVKTGRELLMLWIQGHEVIQAANNPDLFVCKKSTVDKWIEELKVKDIEELMEYERYVLMDAMMLIKKYYGNENILATYDKVFYDMNYKEWHDRFLKHKDLFKYKQMHVLDSITEKINAIMSNPIKCRK